MAVKKTLEERQYKFFNDIYINKYCLDNNIEKIIKDILWQ